MADIVFNVGKGRVVELWRRIVNNDPAASGLILVLLKTVEADSTLVDYNTLAELLAGGNVECDFTNYARQVYTDADLSAPTTDDANDRQDCVLPAKTITAAGGTLDNTILKAVLCYAPDTGGADATLELLDAFDANVTTNGQDLNIPSATVHRSS